jgi:aminoglycoside 3-N-acetyltransferase
MHSRESLARDFQLAGVGPGDVVMLHASVRAVGEIAGGPDQIHLALRDALGDAGTLLMYASCPAYYDDVGRGHLSAEQEAEILQKLPPFDARTARSARDNGALVEFFRTYPGSMVNDHVARFVAAGRQAEYLLSEQPWDFAFGKGSALDRFVHLNGRIVLLGSDHDNVTFLHYAEHIVDVPGKIVAMFKVPVSVAGERQWREMKEFDTSERAHPNWPDRFFARIVDAYLVRSGRMAARVGDASCDILDAPGLLRFALQVMTAVAADAHAADVMLQA